MGSEVSLLEHMVEQQWESSQLLEHIVTQQ
jgi:hypothetical protein